MSFADLSAPLHLTFAAGGGLITGGLAAAVARRRAGAAVGGVVTLVAAGVLEPGQLPTALLLAVLGGALAAAPAPWARAVARVMARRPVAGVSVAAVGVGVIAAGQAWYDAAVDRAERDDLTAMTVAELRRLDTVDALGVLAATDRGTPVRLWRPAERWPGAAVDRTDDACNCHGWVFTGGRYWVGADAVELILTENGYAVVAAPAVGDLVVYRDDAGRVIHTACVVELAGGAVRVEGKGGWFGVSAHDVTESPYGRRFTYHRSPRSGHLLRGLTGPPNS
jgi:hypothetical protein